MKKLFNFFSCGGQCQVNFLAYMKLCLFNRHGELRGMNNYYWAVNERMKSVKPCDDFLMW
jgi:hypothetical protein